MSVVEPGLDELMARASNRRHISTAACGADVLWVCFDTPVDDNDNSDVAFVSDRINAACEVVGPETIILVSSQLPVGTCAVLERSNPRHRFAVSPENLRRGNAVNDFRNMTRAVIGSREPSNCLASCSLRSPPSCCGCRRESAEMVKHALNGFLAISVCYANELGDICADVGADMNDATAACGPIPHRNEGVPESGWGIHRRHLGSRRRHTRHRGYGAPHCDKAIERSPSLGPRRGCGKCRCFLAPVVVLSRRHGLDGKN